MVAQIDEQQAAMVADAVAPAGQAHFPSDIRFPQLAAGMRSITMHG
jgi:uncharacterized protein with gpF-like domain